jgi:hypothetical protein
LLSEAHPALLVSSCTNDIRQRLLAEAQRLFREHGYAATSLAATCRKPGPRRCATSCRARWPARPAGKTYTQVLRLAEQAALTVDPGLAERRREHAHAKAGLAPVADPGRPRLHPGTEAVPA